MKRSVAAALGIGMLACIGCITTAPPEATKVTTAKFTPLPPPPPPVTADLVTPTNGHIIAQKLSDELDYEARLATMPAPTAKNEK